MEDLVLRKIQVLRVAQKVTTAHVYGVKFPWGAARNIFLGLSLFLGGAFWNQSRQPKEEPLIQYDAVPPIEQGNQENKEKTPQPELQKQWNPWNETQYG